MDQTGEKPELGGSLRTWARKEHKGKGEAGGDPQSPCPHWVLQGDTGEDTPRNIFPKLKRNVGFQVRR